MAGHTGGHTTSKLCAFRYGYNSLYLLILSVQHFAHVQSKAMFFVFTRHRIHCIRHQISCYIIYSEIKSIPPRTVNLNSVHVHIEIYLER